jgi:hypothetical protein
MEATMLPASDEILDAGPPDPLGDWLDDEQMDHEGEVDTGIEPWRPQTRADLEWLVGRINACDREADAIRAQADKLIKRQQETKERLLMLFGADMEAIACAELRRENVGKKNPRKSLELLTGGVKWVRSGGGLEVTDPDDLLGWIEETGCWDALRVKVAGEGKDAAILLEAARGINFVAHREFLKTPLAARLKATGELPPGVEIAPVSDRMDVTGPKQ